jgi:hypothetical protein
MSTLKMYKAGSSKTLVSVCHIANYYVTLIFDTSWLIVTEWAILEWCDWVIGKIDIIKLCLYWACPETVRKELIYFDNSVNNILKLFNMEPYLMGHNPQWIKWTQNKLKLKLKLYTNPSSFTTIVKLKLKIVKLTHRLFYNNWFWSQIF